MRNRPGKGKRKAETNFVAAYSGASELAPPPTSRDVLAVPAKLRKIMQLKASVAQGTSIRPQADGYRSERNFSKVMKTNPKGVNSNAFRGQGILGARDGNQLGLNTNPEKPSKKWNAASSSRWKKKEEELKMVLEKMNKRKSGVRASDGERRKSYLNEKRKKRKQKGKNEDRITLPSLHQYEKIEFGDVVRAPPKLSFPKMAVEVKMKEKGFKQEQAVSQERLRLEAIEAYRQRKVWSSRPGQKLSSV